MRLFISSATDYIGINVATAFRRIGCQVFGQTHNADNAPLLESNEITPIISSLENTDSYRHIAAHCDVIIHSASDYQTDNEASDRTAVRSLLEAVQSQSQPKTFIYTSSVWVLGSSRSQPLTEESLPSPAQKVVWRSTVEEIVLTAEGVNGLVIRPGIVYGKGGGLTGMWFQGASNGGIVKIVGDGQNHWAMVHVDDLARGYLKVANSGLSGKVFNLVDASRSTVMEMASAAATAAGNIRQLEFIPINKAVQEMGALGEALALDQVVDASKAYRLFGWQPRHRGFIPEVDTYYRAWRAHRSLRENNYGELYL
jgi:nucleoside-diphosphate-sugar epimerase